MTKARFISMMCGIGVVQLALIILKATGLIQLGWSAVLIPLEAVAVVYILLFLYIVICIIEYIICIIEYIRNGVFDGYSTDAYNAEGYSEGDDNGKE